VSDRISYSGRLLLPPRDTHAEALEDRARLISLLRRIAPDLLRDPNEIRVVPGGKPLADITGTLKTA